MKTTYPPEPLEMNDWFKHIYKLLITPYDKKTGSNACLLAHKRRIEQDRRQQLKSEKAEAFKRRAL